MREPPNSASDGTAASINDCWNRIGVRGDASCPELEQHVHCRNCPVYSAAAADAARSRAAGRTTSPTGRAISRSESGSRSSPRIRSSSFASAPNGSRLPTLRARRGRRAAPDPFAAAPAQRRGARPGQRARRAARLRLARADARPRGGGLRPAPRETARVHAAPAGHPPRRRAHGVSRSTRCTASHRYHPRELEGRARDRRQGRGRRTPRRCCRGRTRIGRLLDDQLLVPQP